MGAFLEERLPVNIRLGASFVDGYAVEITTTASGVEYRKLTHPHPIRKMCIRDRYSYLYCSHLHTLLETLHKYHKLYDIGQVLDPLSHYEAW